jgi:hypothetical protein
MGNSGLGKLFSANKITIFRTPLASRHEATSVEKIFLTRWV